MLSIRPLIVGFVTALGLGLAASGRSQAATRAPACTPATFNTSAINAGSVTVSPLPGSRDASAHTQISFLGVPARDVSRVIATGSRSGSHHGRLLAYRSTLGGRGAGASFVPARPFLEGERVTVHAEIRTGGAPHPLLDRFAIARQDPVTRTPERIHPGRPSEQQGYRSRTDLRPPALSVTASSPAVAPGYEFVAPYGGPGQAGPMILDQNGGLVWFKPLPTYTFATNLRVQEYLGKPVLTWWQGDISVHGYGLGEDLIADRSYTDIAHVRAGNGEQADLHEFQLTPRGTALITAYDPIRCDLSSVGGPADGGVTDGLFQEIDVRTGLVMFQWSSLDHVALSESHGRARDSSTAEPFDYFHINSINLDQDGSLLVSARNTWTTYELNAHSGQIVWRLGGKRSSFKLGPGAATAWQHDARQLADGSISVFDNGASPAVHGQSRGISIALDAQDRTATLVTQVVHSPALVSDSQGNLQALQNGDWFLGWGQVPDFSEFNAAGQLLLDAHFPPRTQSYRDLRFTWTGTPAHPPAFAFQPGAAGAGTVYASWNGATLVSSWRVLSGSRPSSLGAVAQVARSGFETAIALPPGAHGTYMTVQALDASGGVLGTAVVAKV
jgi:hypothetical protein